MPLWGTEDTLEGKPKIHGRSLLDATQTPGELDPRTGIYATTAGWVQGGAGRTGKNLMPEVLVAIRGLSTRATGEGDTWTTAAMAQANITSFNWNISEWSRAAGGTLSVTANFNEAVDVTGTPRLTVVNDSRSNHTLSYASGTGSNRLTFTLVIAAANAAIHATDVLSVGANAMAHNGGSTIVDSLGGGNSVITNSAGIGTATGTITAVA
jgi:hypothetical protein